jgi:hypothetical protein
MYVPVSPTLAEWDDCPMAVLVWSREIYANQYGWFNELLKLSMHVLSADGLNIGSSVKKKHEAQVFTCGKHPSYFPQHRDLRTTDR